MAEIRASRGCAEEAIAVGMVSGIRLGVGDPAEHIRKLGGKIPGAGPSMLLISSRPERRPSAACSQRAAERA
jgi:hypothetical protein